MKRSILSKSSQAWVTLALLTCPAAETLRAQSAWLDLQRPSGRIELRVAGSTGTTNSVYFTTSLSTETNWTLLTNLVLDSLEPVPCTDHSSTNVSHRFYRVITTALSVTNPSPGELAWIPPGTFTLGSPATDTDRNGNESPQTTVRISRGFYMSKYEITQTQYSTLMGGNPSLHADNPYAPVDSVSWQDATNYCNHLTARERTAGRLPAGYLYRLPTEAEWEYAARAGTTNRFYYGDDPGYAGLPNHAWFGGIAALPNHTVGQKARNRWGLHDMHGNVYEWCLDWLGVYPGGTVIDPKGVATTRPCLRGGSSSSISKDCRTASRLRAYAAGDNYANAGFRVVLALPLP